MKRATIRTRFDHADVIAASVSPDNTPEMDTRVEGDCILTTIERGTTGGLQSTVDDYVVNLSVAARTAALATGGESTDESHEHERQPNETQQQSVTNHE